MIRILTLHPRDWFGRNATYVERSLHEILARIASQGHYAAWLCGRCLPLGRPKDSTRELEVLDGIHMARLGPVMFYRPFSRMFLDRLAKSEPCPFDVIVNCINGRALDVEAHAKVPVLPLVFGVAGRVPTLQNAKGPVVAMTRLAANRLQDLGVPAQNIVLAPMGVGNTEHRGRTSNDKRLVASIGGIDGVRRFSLKARRMATHLASRGLVVRNGKLITEKEQPWAVYCGAGQEWEALEYAAQGIPAVCPDTPAARECIVAEETGLLHRIGDMEGLKRQFERIAEDEVLYKRLSDGAARFAGLRSWDRSAGLVLAAIENMLAKT